jgi:hypothetical protein
MKLVKLSRVSRQPFFDDKELKLGTAIHHDDYDRLMNKYYGKVTLSIKIDKKRILVKGKIDCHWDDQQDGLFIHWYFLAKDEKHLTKLKVALS